MKKMFKIIALVLAVMFVFGACSNETYTTTSDDKNTTDAVSNSDAETTEAVQSNSHSSNYDGTHPRVKFTMENGGEFIVELYPEYAPETVDNFVDLVLDDFYDGLTFHRVVEGFMAQGGDPEGTGYGGSDEEIYGEFAINGFTQNTLSHTRGVISMARSTDYDSASSQFFICYDDATFLDGQYAAFGMVTEGMEVVDSFLEVERVYSGRELSKPIEPIVIEKAEVI